MPSQPSHASPLAFVPVVPDFCAVAAATIAALLLSCLMSAPAAAAIEGTVRDAANGNAIAGAFVALLSPDWSPLLSAATNGDGAFSMAIDAPEEAYLVVQPPARPSPDDMQVFSNQPRIYLLNGPQDPLDLRLPPAVNLVLQAYGKDGKLLRWEDFEARGRHGGQFLYATTPEDESTPAAVWPVHGVLTGGSGGPREKGLPAVLAGPGDVVAVSVLFWETAGYGKLLLRADNGGQGYSLSRPGDSILLNLNVALAQSALAKLQQQAPLYGDEAAGGIAELAQLLEEAAAAPEPEQAAALADEVLAEALRLRDDLEIEAARRRIAAERQGRVHVVLEGDEADGYSEYEAELRQVRHDFLFGAFEGSPYNAEAFEAAREGGFNLATVLLGWNWTQNPRLNAGGIKQTFGIPQLRELGYRVKAHGVIWMQDYGILPAFAKELDAATLKARALAHQEALLDEFAGDIDIWEAMNEPASTNVTDLPREDMYALLEQAAQNIAAADKPALVNGPHEFGYGAQYFMYHPDGSQVNSYPRTFSAFLRAAEAKDALDATQIIGLQFYPGFHLNETFGGQQGPAYTPSYILDTLDRYARFGKTLHITELSMPSSYGDDWFSGYWRAPWDEETQADYAEAVFTLAFAHPSVQSVGWWDIMDIKPAVITGGLLHADGTPKPVFERLRGLIDKWTTNETASFEAEGTLTLGAFAGYYVLRVTGPDGFEHEEEFHLLEGFTREVRVDVGGS